MDVADRGPSPLGCRSCGSFELATFLSLGSLPLADALLRADQLGEPEKRYPLDVALCSTCSLVQILASVPAEDLFCRDYPYYSSFSTTLVDHSRRNVEACIASRRLDERTLVVEIASNDGYLLQHYRDRDIPVLGIDPAEGPASAAAERGIPTLRAFFDRELAQDLVRGGKRAAIVHANNVLAHVEDLNSFVEGIAHLLADDGIAVIEVPYVKDLVDRCEFDTIYHEHRCYFSVTSLAPLFARHGLVLTHVDPLSIHGGSLRLFVARSGHPSDSLQSYLRDESEAGVDRITYYEHLSRQVESIREQLRELLRGLKRRGASLAGYGAAAKATVMLNYVGIGPDLLEFVVDRNVHKQGLFMPGARIPILEPAELLRRKPDYALLFTWNLQDEIVAQQKEYQRAGGRFIVPIPTPTILRAEPTTGEGSD